MDTVHAIIFTWFYASAFSGKESAQIYSCNYLDWALVQWQNMAACEYKNIKIAKIQIRKVSPHENLSLI